MLEFVLAVLDAPSLDALARVTVEAMVGRFGAGWAAVRDEEVTWVEVRAPVAPAGALTLGFRLTASEEPAVRLELEIERGPDLAIVRQQFLDLVAVVRRAWRDRIALEAEHRRARIDELTGLENRRALEEYLAQSLTSSRPEERRLCVMLVDLDHFKTINDREGHAAGDEVLRTAASVMREHIGAQARACRWGGDEFLLALPGCSVGDAAAMADRMRRAFRGHAGARGATMTIGVADSDQVARGPDAVVELLAAADDRLYEAKRSGRDCVAVSVEHRKVV